MSNDNSPTPDLQWSSIVKAGARQKVPSPLSRVDIKGNRENYEVRILFEDPEISDFLRQQRALSIVNTALQPGAVIFSLPSRLFKHQSDAYKLIVDDIGPVVGNYFNPLSLRGNRNRGDLVFYTKFRQEADTQFAITNGLLIDGIQYKGIPYKDKTMANDFTRVNFTLPLCDEERDLVQKLKSSLSNYGQVLQIKQLLNRGFFEGEVSVLLDRRPTTQGNGEYQELQRMLYLDAWDVFAPASYKGAKPICYYCRAAGHVKKDCAILQQLVCFRCKKSGHTQRRCRADFSETELPPDSPAGTQDTSFEEDLEAYTTLSQQHKKLDAKEKTVVQNDDKAFDNDQMESDLPSDTQEDSVAIQSDDDMDFVDADYPTAVASSQNPTKSLTPLLDALQGGSSASRYAPPAANQGMAVDFVPSPRRSARKKMTDQEQLNTITDNSPMPILTDDASSASQNSVITHARKGNE